MSVRAGSTRSEGVDLLGSATVLLIKSLFLCSMDGPILSSLYSVSPLRNVKSHFTVRCVSTVFPCLLLIAWNFFTNPKLKILHYLLNPFNIGLLS